MERALELARLGRGFTSPNPCVGCVIVRDGEVVAEGYHRKAGEDHAEIDALRKIDFRAEGCEVYVTLEPCTHVGRTGPCSDALEKAGVRKVYVGMADPLEKKREKRKKKKDYEVEFLREGDLAREIEDLNGPFLKDAAGSALPYIVLKAAMSLDSRMTDFEGRSKWITSEEARLDAKKERSFCDAVLVGAGTVRADDPELAAADGFEGKRLLRVILGEDVPGGARVFRDENVVVMKGELREVLANLKRDHGVQSVFVEGGAAVHGEFLRSWLVDKAIFYYAPLVLGGDGVVMKDFGLRLDEAISFAETKATVLKSGEVKVELWS